jgi:hypothetical protein
MSTWKPGYERINGSAFSDLANVGVEAPDDNTGILRSLAGGGIKDFNEPESESECFDALRALFA